MKSLSLFAGRTVRQIKLKDYTEWGRHTDYVPSLHESRELDLHQILEV